MSTQTLKRKEVRTRKRHRCDICQLQIRKGAKAIYWAGVHDGDFFHGYSHAVCQYLLDTHFDGYDDEMPDPYDFRTEILRLPLLKPERK